MFRFNQLHNVSTSLPYYILLHFLWLKGVVIERLVEKKFDEQVSSNFNKVLIFAILALPTTAKPRPGAAAADLRLPPGVWRVLYAGLGHLISFFGSGHALLGSCERVFPVRANS